MLFVLDKIDLKRLFDNQFKEYRSYDKLSLEKGLLIEAIDNTYEKLVDYADKCKLSWIDCKNGSIRCPLVICFSDFYADVGLFYGMAKVRQE